MTDKRKVAKDGPDADAMKEMRDRYDRAVTADSENRTLALEDLRFVAVPGNQWEEAQRKARKGRPCYEFPVLRSHWRQVVNDQKKARPGIKVRAVEDGDAKGAELRQGLIRNIEATSNAERAYDGAFELLTASGFGAWRVKTAYSSDDAWEQDIKIQRIADPLSTVWFDPDAMEPDLRDAKYCFVEETLSREQFEARYPKAEAVDFESAKKWDSRQWFGEGSVRVAEYWRLVPVTKTLLLLSDGKTVDKAEVTPEVAADMDAKGVTIVKTRECHSHKVVMSIVSGAEEIDGPHDSVFHRIPIVPVYANRHFIEGKWRWSGLVRPAKDSQRLVNYNLTTGQETLAKQHKAVPIVTPKMLEGEGVKRLWDSSNAADAPYLPITPDPQMPGGPSFLTPPPIHAAFVNLGQMSIDLVKSATGIFDASLGAKSNETSGRAILARQAEGDTATYDYQDSLAFGIQATGEIVLHALPKVYDTPRAMRVLGKDGGEQWVQINDGANDLSAGKYDVTVTTGPSYDTQRMEFVDALTQLGQGNPAIAAGVPDLIVGALDFPKAEEAAERLKLLLPPQVQQAMAQGKDLPPEAVQAMQQAEQAMQQAQQMGQMAQQAMAEVEQAQAAVNADKAAADAQRSQTQADIKLANADFARQRAEFETAKAQFEAQVARAEASLAQRATQHTLSTHESAALYGGA